MTDREKTITHLKAYVNCYANRNQICNKNCVLYGYGDCAKYIVESINNALELLKEQELVPPIAEKEMDEITSCLETVYYCGNCHVCLPLYKEYNVFCPKCGRKVKWDE